VILTPEKFLTKKNFARAEIALLENVFAETELLNLESNVILETTLLLIITLLAARTVNSLLPLLVTTAMDAPATISVMEPEVVKDPTNVLQAPNAWIFLVYLPSEIVL